MRAEALAGRREQVSAFVATALARRRPERGVEGAAGDAPAGVDGEHDAQRALVVRGDGAVFAERERYLGGAPVDAAEAGEGAQVEVGDDVLEQLEGEDI